MTKTNRLTLAVALATLAPLSAKAEVAYDNTSGYQGVVTSRGNLEVGDEINLTSGPATITDFKFEYNYTGVSPLATGVLRIYANDGPVLPSSTINTPGTLLLQSDPFALESGFHQGIISMSLAVPGRITWTVDFDGVLPTDNAGLLFYNGVGVGSGPGQSNDDHWENNGTVATPSWVLVDNQNPIGLVDNFGAQVTVVPEPGTIALFVGGAALLGMAARRRKS
jgi:hypothetical protein